MPNKLSQYCEGIMEAAWLAAVIVVPVFFNVFSSRIFEPDKITLLRTLSLLVLAAWLIKLFAEGGVRWEKLQPGENKLKTIFNIPLVVPVLALAAVYIIATIFSIVPRVSFWGSYQRLQGTYTTFSYLVLFAAILGNLRRRAQVERLITAVIVSSLPVALYGVLQRYQIDPVPWGGNVSSRIAANMGNSIFVAAYFIMVFPLTLVRIVHSFSAILNNGEKLVINFARATAYVFIAALQVIALYFSGSRGPWLGWGASLIFTGLVLSLIWRKRWLTISGVGIALVAAVFLIVLNIPNGPLESIRSIPGIGRLGQLLDAESRTGRVRTLIWKGAAELVLPHQPLEYPDGHKDPLNAIRILIGYGPESMYVAYNPFYQPELTQVEQRNASPDRSHNETWDSLVITGVIGLLVYLLLFGSVFYYGLKWLGLITSNRQRNLFLGLFIGGGIVSSLIFIPWQGREYFGVALPFGMVVGLVIYLILASLFGNYNAPQTPGEKLRAITLMGFLAVILAHWVEINFGIAIAATRTYFWVFSGLIVAVGYVLPLHGEYGQAALTTARDENLAETLEPASQPASVAGRKGNRTAPASKKKRRSQRSSPRLASAPWPEWLQDAASGGFLTAVLLATLGYNLISNLQGNKSAMQVLWNSMVSLRSGSGISYGVLAMMVTTWIVASLVVASESEHAEGNLGWSRMVLVVLGISLAGALLFWLWHASGLASLASTSAADIPAVLRQIGRYENLLTRYYVYLFLMILSAGFFLVPQWTSRGVGTSMAAVALAPLALIAVMWIASYTNLRVIQADIAFKLADPFTRGNQWPVAIAIYDRANSLAPTEDYYYLFLGRAYLEEAKTLSDATQREALISRAAQDLKKAQTISPLNTDHTANLARLYSLWASFASDPKVRQERAQTSIDYFSMAVTLSPKNARLWDEWALLYLNILQQPDQALPRLQQALSIDPYYDWTYGLMGDYYARSVSDQSDSQQKQDILQKAADSYQKALELVAPNDPLRYNYALALGGVDTQLDRPQDAITAYQKALQASPQSPDSWRIEETIARLYAQNGDMVNALSHARNALAKAPDAQKGRLQAFINQMSGQP